MTLTVTITDATGKQIPLDAKTIHIVDTNNVVPTTAPPMFQQQQPPPMFQQQQPPSMFQQQQQAASYKNGNFNGIGGSKKRRNKRKKRTRKQRRSRKRSAKR